MSTEKNDPKAKAAEVAAAKKASATTPATASTTPATNDIEKAKADKEASEKRRAEIEKVANEKAEQRKKEAEEKKVANEAKNKEKSEAAAAERAKKDAERAAAKIAKEAEKLAKKTQSDADREKKRAERAERRAQGLSDKPWSDIEPGAYQQPPREPSVLATCIKMMDAGTGVDGEVGATEEQMQLAIGAKHPVRQLFRWANVNRGYGFKTVPGSTPPRLMYSAPNLRVPEPKPEKEKKTAAAPPVATPPNGQPTASA